MNMTAGLHILQQHVIYFTPFTCGFVRAVKCVVISGCDVAGFDAGLMRTD